MLKNIFKRNKAFLCVSCLIYFLFFFTVLAFGREQYPGQYANSPFKHYFEKLRNKKDWVCCDVSDCKTLETDQWDTQGKTGPGYSGFRYIHEGKWHDVENWELSEARENNGKIIPNPTKKAVACVLPTQSGPMYRCFTPGPLF